MHFISMACERPQEDGGGQSHF